jgi:hypothetical protein
MPSRTVHRTPPQRAKLSVAPKIPAIQQAKILQMAAAGKSLREIAREQNRDRRTVTKIVNQPEMLNILESVKSRLIQLGIHAVLPFADIERTFSPADVEAYRELIGRATVEVLSTCGTDEDAYLAAGQRIVELSEILVAVWNGKPAKGKGGTADVVGYAIQRKRPVIQIDPVTRTIRQR